MKRKLKSVPIHLANAQIRTPQLPFRVFLPDEGCVLWSDKHKQTHSHKLLRCEQHILVVPRYVFLKLSSPKFLVRGAETKTKLHVTIQWSKDKKKYCT